MAISLDHHASGHSTAASTDVSVTITSTTGNLIVVACASAGNNQVSSVTDDKSNTYVQVPNVNATANASADRTDIWYCNAATTGVTSITVHFAGAGATVKDAIAFDVTGFTLAVVDAAGRINDQPDGGTNNWNGASVTTRATAGFAVGVGKCPAGSTIDQNPQTSNEFSSGGDICTGSDSAACSLIYSTAAAHQPAWHDGNSFENHAVSTAAFMEQPPIPSFRVNVNGGTNLRPRPFAPGIAR